MTATLADKSITFTQESQEASSWANRDDQVYEFSVREGIERGRNGEVERARRERSDEFWITGTRRLPKCWCMLLPRRLREGELQKNIDNKHGIE